MLNIDELNNYSLEATYFLLQSKLALMEKYIEVFGPEAKLGNVSASMNFLVEMHSVLREAE